MRNFNCNYGRKQFPTVIVSGVNWTIAYEIVLLEIKWKSAILTWNFSRTSRRRDYYPWRYLLRIPRRWFSQILVTFERKPFALYNGPGSFIIQCLLKMMACLEKKLNFIHHRLKLHIQWENMKISARERMIFFFAKTWKILVLRGWTFKLAATSEVVNWLSFFLYVKRRKALSPINNKQHHHHH